SRFALKSLPSWQGLALPSTSLLPLGVKRFVQVIPIRVHRIDQPHFPSPRPTLDRCFALNGCLDRIVPLHVDEAGKLVSRCEPLDRARSMLPRTACDIVGDADIERSVL